VAPLFGAAIYGLAVLTDFLDGFFARRRNQVTRLGIILDPLADKLLNAAALLSLVEMGLAPAWVVMIILAREIAVTGLRNVAAGRGLLIRASGMGKAKMVAQVTAILVLLLSRPWPALRIPGLVALGFVVLVTLVSGWTTSCGSGNAQEGSGGDAGRACGAPTEPPRLSDPSDRQKKEAAGTVRAFRRLG
jgi:CDP-diacylglycerol--glycerol-3-phosphate 3-phosphatidyltransferase